MAGAAGHRLKVSLDRLFGQRAGNIELPVAGANKGRSPLGNVAHSRPWSILPGRRTSRSGSTSSPRATSPGRPCGASATRPGSPPARSSRRTSTPCRDRYTVPPPPLARYRDPQGAQLARLRPGRSTTPASSTEPSRKRCSPSRRTAIASGDREKVRKGLRLPARTGTILNGNPESFMTGMGCCWPPRGTIRFSPRRSGGSLRMGCSHEAISLIVEVQ